MGCGPTGGAVDLRTGGTDIGRSAEVNVGEEDEIIEAEIEEPAEPTRAFPTPEMPSRSDVDKHREDYIPYRSWCDHCVEGRGREAGHHIVDATKRTVPIVSFDYVCVSTTRAC